MKYPTRPLHALRPSRRPVAWLALLALWLTIVAPVVSQTLASPLDSLVGIGVCGASHADGARTPPAGHPLESCGYCGMLAGHSLLPDAVAPAVPLAAIARHSTPLPALMPGHSWRRLAAEPRGPPAGADA